jgi:hypothetical protein
MFRHRYSIRLISSGDNGALILQGWQLNREKRLRLLASRWSGARIKWQGQHM